MDDNIGAYCSLDQAGRRPTHELTTGEKEQLFLEAMSVRRRRLLDLEAGCWALLCLSQSLSQTLWNIELQSQSALLRESPASLPPAPA